MVEDVCFFLWEEDEEEEEQKGGKERKDTGNNAKLDLLYTSIVFPYSLRSHLAPVPPQLVARWQTRPTRGMGF